MNISSILPFFVRLVVGTGFIFTFCIPMEMASAMNSNKSPHTSVIPSISDISHTDSLLLTEQKVKNWIKTRIAVAKLQNQMKANASDYDNVVREFYTKREGLLESRGWSVKEFETAKERIHAAISAMDIADELEESRAEHEQEIADIKANEYYSGVQKKEMIEMLSEMREQKKTQYIEPTKSDWAAVRPYRSIFQQMAHWIAGNTSSPPVIE